MSRPIPRRYEATVLRRVEPAPGLVRIQVAVPQGFVTTGIADEWVALTVPDQFQTRYYTIRSIDDEAITIDIVIHPEGLVTNWARGACVGDVVGLSEPQGSYEPPAEAEWVVAVGDLTALPAIARIAETTTLPVHAFVESTIGPVEDYTAADIVWSAPADDGASRLADLVAGLAWPTGPGYFWMAGESAQMRAIRHHVRHDLALPSAAVDLMGYWSIQRGRRMRRQGDR